MVDVLLNELGEDQDVIKVDKDKVVVHVPKHVVLQCLKITGLLVSPKGITKYS